MSERHGEPEPPLRLATSEDRDPIDTLMKASTRALFPAFYDAKQTASSVVHIAHVDPMLIGDGTYFVLEAGGEIVACGGWSRRDKLFSGSAEQEGRARRLAGCRVDFGRRCLAQRLQGDGRAETAPAEAGQRGHVVDGQDAGAGEDGRGRHGLAVEAAQEVAEGLTAPVTGAGR